MTRPYLFNIQLFMEHFREQGNAIAAVSSELHRKILYCSALDPLARAIYTNGIGHRVRIVSLLLEHTNWVDARRVSLFQLSCTLREKKRTRFALYRESKRRLDSCPPRRSLLISSSPELSEMRPYVAPEEERALKQQTYGELFYTYRNNLIHEYREPGYGHDWSRKATEPFYTNLSAFGQRELVFPILFISSLYEQALQGVERHLLLHKINPHSRFEYGSRWRAE